MVFWCVERNIFANLWKMWFSKISQIFIFLFKILENGFLRGSMGPKLSNKVRGVVENRTKRFLITQTCGGGDFFMIFMEFHKNGFEIATSCIRANVMVWLEARRKNFENTLEIKICFQTHLWVHGYPQKQTGMSYDAWNDFYDGKRAEVAIFWFQSFQIAILMHFERKWKVFEIFENHILQRMVQKICSMHPITIK